jgi:uncharacterized protein
MCRFTQNSVVRLVRMQSVAKPCGVAPLTNEQAIAALKQIMLSTNFHFRDEPMGVFDFWMRLSARTTASPKVWADAYLAAFAVCGGVQLVSFHTDFAKCEPAGLKWINPAVASI